MFFPRKTPGQSRPERLAALRISLNAPVVNAEELPAGPARAAIALFLEPGDRSVLEVRVRSEKTGKIVAYGFDGTLEDPIDVDRAFEGALTFAESMGFLFDDDVLSGDDTLGRREVAALWSEFETGAPGSRRPPAAEREPRSESEPELELTEVAKGDAALVMELSSGWSPDGSEIPVAKTAPVAKPKAAARPAPKPAAKPAPKPAPPAPPAPVAAAKPAPPPPAPAAAPAAPPETALLSKFRGRKPQPAGTALGRVPIVRRRGGKPAKERPSFLARLLGAF